jgi:hypothetical protein
MFGGAVGAGRTNAVELYGRCAIGDSLRGTAAVIVAMTTVHVV